MKYTRPTDGLDRDARLHVEGVLQTEKSKPQADTLASRECQEGRHGRCAACS